jgi:hypothetical protein
MTERLIADGLSAKRAERLATLCAASLQGALIQARGERAAR